MVIIMSGTCALVVPWHVSGFGYATGIMYCKVDGTAHYAEDYATQRIYVTCGVWHGIYVTYNVVGVARDLRYV